MMKNILMMNVLMTNWLFRQLVLLYIVKAPVESHSYLLSTNRLCQLAAVAARQAGRHWHGVRRHGRRATHHTEERDQGPML